MSHLEFLDLEEKKKKKTEDRGSGCVLFLQLTSCVIWLIYSTSLSLISSDVKSDC